MPPSNRLIGMGLTLLNLAVATALAATAVHTWPQSEFSGAVIGAVAAVHVAVFAELFHTYVWSG